MNRSSCSKNRGRHSSCSRSESGGGGVIVFAVIVSDVAVAENCDRRSIQQQEKGEERDNGDSDDGNVVFDLFFFGEGDN